VSAVSRAAPTTSRVATAPPWWRALRTVTARLVGAHRTAPLTWGGALGALSALIAAIWPSIEGSISELVRKYPEGLKSAFGIDRLDSVEAYIDAEMLSIIVPLAIAFFAVRCVTAATVGAEERGHLDVLLALPLSRRVLVAAAFAATGIATAAVLAVIWAMTCIAGLLAGTGIDAATMAAGFGDVWPLAMFFAGLAAFAAGLTPRSARVTGAALGTLVAKYVLDLVGKVAHELEPVRVVSAFRYYGSAVQDGLDVWHVLLLTAAGAVLAGAGALLLDRRDLA
jgi:ABC-2 type transport system permease protein